MMKIILLFLVVFNLISCGGSQCEHQYEILSESISTCTTNGVVIKKCAICEEEKKELLPLLEHQFILETIAATCQTVGYSMKVCSVCDKQVIENEVAKIPHQFIESIFEPSCTSEGYVMKECQVCNYQERGETLSRVPHTYQETIHYPTCLNSGYKELLCNICGDQKIVDYIDALGHQFSEWITIVNPTQTSDGIQERYCSVCSEKEVNYLLAAIDYIDLSVIKEDYDATVNYRFEDYETLLAKFEAAVLRMIENFTCEISFEIADLRSFLGQLLDDCQVPFSVGLNAKMQGTKLTLTLDYTKNIPSKSTENICYQQYNSANYQPATAIRSDDFNDFNINKSVYSFAVFTTEQLYYVLERGVKPVCVEGSEAALVYAEIQNILRQIINDDMSDLEKVKAIHDYLVMNVVYDNDLLMLLYNGSENLKAYRGFYLEGVFFDKKAVCEGISKAFTVMCNIEGIPCVTVEGYQTQNPSGAGHAWNKVYLNNKWYIVDATSDGVIVNSSFEVLSYQYFLISESKFEILYTETSFLNIICEDNYNPYVTCQFVYGDVNYDFKITSQEELVKLVSYFARECDEYSTIEFYLDYDYGDSALDEIEKAYLSSFIFDGFSYMDNGCIFMLIK